MLGKLWLRFMGESFRNHLVQGNYIFESLRDKNHCRVNPRSDTNDECGNLKLTFASSHIQRPGSCMIRVLVLSDMSYIECEMRIGR